jgi:hypothetical protein
MAPEQVISSSSLPMPYMHLHHYSSFLSSNTSGKHFGKYTTTPLKQKVYRGMGVFTI